jgi:hypothetical protein
MKNATRTVGNADEIRKKLAYFPNTSVGLNNHIRLLIRSKNCVYLTRNAETMYWAWTKYCTHFFINMVLDHFLSSMQTQFFLEWTRESFQQSLAEIYTILLEEYLQVAL